MKNFGLILFLIAFITASSCSGNGEDKSQAKKTDAKTKTAVWISFDEGLAKAKSENKNILIDFYTDWCHWCKVMDEKTFQESTVNQKLAERFITVRLNAEDKTKTATYKGQTFNNIELTQAFGVKGFPSLAFLTPDGEIITMVPGYVPAETFIYILKYIDQGCYKQQMSFEEFMKKKGECEDPDEKKKM